MVCFHAPPELKLPLFKKSSPVVEEVKDDVVVTVATATPSPAGSVRTAV